MGKIIGFLNQKGGVGKTTLTALTATALACPPFNKKVFAIDVDRQQSLIRRRLGDLQAENVVPPYKLEYKTISQLLGEIEGIANANDYIFLDAPGKLDDGIPAEQQEITKIILLADYIFIPVAPGNFAMDATIDFLRIAMKAKAIRKDRPLQIIGLVNMAEPRTIDDKFLVDEVSEIEGILPFMDNKLNRYALFRSADTLETLYQENSKDRATENFSTWLNEFYKIIENG